jgi:PAS domain S-box-containing protein
MPPAGAAPWRGLLQLFWNAPYPATLQDAQWRLLDVNAAFVELTGRRREALIGLDPLELQPPEDQAPHRAERAEVLAAAAAGAAPPPLHRRLIDGAGQQRWFTVALHDVAPPGQGPLWLAVLQEVSAEYQARDQSRRLQDELEQWFELAGAGMVAYDEGGLIVRCNAAFEALVEQMPEVMQRADPALQALLGWQGGGIAPALVPGALVQQREALVPLPGGQRRRLAARVACYSGPLPGRLRVMAVVEDRSAEDERAIAQLEMGMLMDTASVGVATFDPARGWLAPRRAAPLAEGAGGGAAGKAGTAGAAGPASGALLSISRELVEPESRPEYERLQRALRQGERTEVRYRVRHPELGARWLLTRVEPRSLADGRTTTSVVTLDVTEQERAQRRNEQLLRELTTILDSSQAGIAYLRGPVLVRCNRRFERLISFAPGAAAGATLGEILSHQAVPPAVLQGAIDALAEGRPFEAEFAQPGSAAQRWLALAMHPAEAGDPAHEAGEAVAVLTDITRLKAQQAELERTLGDRDLMFDLSEVGIAYLRGARIERANRAMAALTGYAAPELTTLDPAELYVDARECVDFEARIAAALATEGRFVDERRLRRRDGSLVWVQVSARPVRGEDDAAAPGMICSFVDVDERRQARERLARQAENTRAVLNSVLVGIVTVSARGIEWMNRSARRMFGGELSDFVGEPIATVATPEPDHPLRRGDWMQRLADGHSETFECRLQGRDGREFWVVGNAVLSGGDPASRQLTFALLDIERRRQAEISIAQAQASLQRLIETAPLVIALFDARSLRILQANQTASGFFARGGEALIGQLPEEALPTGKAAALRQWLLAAAVSEAPGRHEWRDAAGTAGLLERVWDCRVSPLAAQGDGADPPTQLLLVASDVTEQRAAEQARLAAAIAQREVLVREVHHRIKNNLQGVAGLLRQNAARHPELAEVLSEAVGQVQAIAQVYGLQVGAGGGAGPLALGALIEAIAASVQRTFGRAIEVHAAGLVHVLPEAEAIPVALTLNELFTNAIKHGERHGGAVRCEVRSEGAGVAVRIASRALLAPGFDLAQLRSGVSGLGLVRALLPRRSAALALEQAGDEVVATVELRPPSVRVPEPGGDEACATMPP